MIPFQFEAFFFKLVPTNIVEAFKTWIKEINYAVDELPNVMTFKYTHIF